MARKDIVTGEGNAFVWDKEGVRAIQETFSINPQMLRHTQDAPEVPEEAKKEYIEVVGAELATVPVFVDYNETLDGIKAVQEMYEPRKDLEKEFHDRGEHLALTANTLGKVWHR